MTHLKPGDNAPKFTSIDQDGNDIKLSDFLGKKVVLYFYPKDNTPTCTVEACNFRDNHSILKKKGFIILGVSPDSERKHRNFIKKFNLPFTLIADKNNAIIDAYGVWGPKKFMGREYEGLLRTTFVIDEKGKIERVFNKVKSKEHTQQILETYPS